MAEASGQAQITSSSLQAASDQQSREIRETGEAVPWAKPDEFVYDPKKPLPKLPPVGGNPDLFARSYTDLVTAYFAFLRHPFNVPAATVAEALAVERGVLCLPGSYFGPGNERHLRIAFANADGAAIETLPDRFRGFSMR